MVVPMQHRQYDRTSQKVLASVTIGSAIPPSSLKIEVTVLYCCQDGDFCLDSQVNGVAPLWIPYVEL